MSRPLLASEAESYNRSGQKQYEDTQSNGNDVPPLFISSLEKKI
jgi:hypothetical protein